MAQHFTMSQQLSSALDDWIAEQPEPRPTRPEAIRRLIEAGLQAQDKIPVRNRKPDVGGDKRLPPTPARSARGRRL